MPNLQGQLNRLALAAACDPRSAEPIGPTQVRHKRVAPGILAQMGWPAQWLWGPADAPAEPLVP